MNMKLNFVKSTVIILVCVTVFLLQESQAATYQATGAYYKWTVDDQFTGSSTFSNTCYFSKSLTPCTITVDADFGDGLGFRRVFPNTPSPLVSVYETTGTKTVRVTTSGSPLVTHTVTVPSLFSPFPLDQWRITADTAYAGSYGSGDVYIYNSTWTRSATIDKPILIVDGFDHGNAKKAEELFYEINQQNLIEELRGRGYDVIVLNPDDGSGWIQKNAYLLVKLIGEISRVKTGSEKIVIMGPSMGGLIARYALSYMEKNQLNHDARLYISFDTPHKGANIPIGVQHFVDFFHPKSLSAAAAKAEFDSPAARQMLLNHYLGQYIGYGSTYDFVYFYDDINRMIFPAKTRNIAFANGSGIQSNMVLTPSGERRAAPNPGVEIVHWDYRDNSNCGEIVVGERDPTEVRGNVYATGPNVVTFDGRTEYCGTDNFPGSLGARTNTASTSAYDSAPGGVYGAPFRVAEGSAPWGDITTSYPYVTFIPLISALNLNTEDLFFRVDGAQNLSSLTPFERVYYSIGDNEPHVYISSLTKDRLLFEVDFEKIIGTLVPAITLLLI